VTVYSNTWSNRSSSAVGNTLLFASMVLDPVTNLYYDEARWYSTAVSTFISRDPVRADENLYRYCGNMPTQATDPSGLLVVHIWNYTGTKSAWGHASMTLDDGRYISWWPRAGSSRRG
jgi:RHS repeat-associated protein